jgi:Superinfection immunity protein
MQDGSGGLVVLLLIFVAATYFLPAIVAAMRRHHNSVAIFVLNLLLGWTLIGWVGALVWACTVVNRPAHV